MRGQQEPRRTVPPTPVKGVKGPPQIGRAQRTPIVSAIEDEANKAVAAQLAALSAPELTDREAVLVTLAIRAGIGAALRTLTKEGA